MLRSGLTHFRPKSFCHKARMILFLSIVSVAAIAQQSKPMQSSQLRPWSFENPSGYRLAELKVKIPFQIKTILIKYVQDTDHEVGFYKICEGPLSGKELKLEFSAWLSKVLNSAEAELDEGWSKIEKQEEEMTKRGILNPKKPDYKRPRGKDYLSIDSARKALKLWCDE